MLKYPLFQSDLPIVYGVSQCRHGSMSFGGQEFLQEVIAARQAFKKELGVSYLLSCRQIHGEEIALIEQPIESDLELEGFDALITNMPGVGLMIQQADCQAVMLYDPVRKVVANVHSGWRGSVSNIIAKTIGTMASQFEVRPADLHAAISPSLGPCCAEFINYRQELPINLHQFSVKENYFDFWEISRHQLRQTGVLPENINIAGICTVCRDDYFSYRRAKDTGRFASVIALQHS